ncbi:hypothetical protein GDO81_028890 [Engystomops pustulosus]|uniref:Uncharacterized protein n=1 Tax=Engystomops pustulosus TaxID=76066 RepID=A0AAV6YND8_ENGPU|nr:hypothetical protein GDO81_028890 [Engystomops pustulosus]
MYYTMELNDFMFGFFHKQRYETTSCPNHRRCPVTSNGNHFLWSYVLRRKNLHHSVVNIYSLSSFRQRHKFHQLFSHDVTNSITQNDG